jgi:hypothetical protein
MSSRAIKVFVKNHRIFISILVLIGMLGAWWLAAPLRGQIAAHLDVWRGHYRVLGYGLPTSSRPEYARLLRERYGIEFRPVAGCVVSEALISYVRGYNEVSTAAANREFGHDVFKECAETASKSWGHQASHVEPQWQETDQLCGVLEFVTPKKKIIVVNGKTETRLYENPVKEAEVLLYRGTVLDEACCSQTTPVARTQSNKNGAFEFLDFPSGRYWLRVNKDVLNATIPVQITGDFNSKSCTDPLVGRIFTVDAQPPKVQTRIY